MIMCEAQYRRSFLKRAPIASVFGLMFLSASAITAGGQTGATPAESTAWQAWTFVRLGGGSGGYSLGGGVAASYGMVLGMVRATDNEPIFGHGVRDNALLIGFRSRADHLFVAGAVGIDRATAFKAYDSGTITGSPQTTFAYDLSAHAEYKVVGLALAVSGAVGPQRTSYVAVTLGAELGWFPH